MWGGEQALIKKRRRRGLRCGREVYCMRYVLNGCYVLFLGLVGCWGCAGVWRSLSG
ncbi:hypothetical protein L873DRAFT_1806565 [Choiromyces venosus 120613-1]|uniref:Uncharacterized protein n=1 Tax=Choiromyces venosus 120613-1 TaxID=1336337 RepID=A0A3N4JS25_9PEZI|nr:hypothetical protein L873DRAFT_1806565 [Choiromyces venosus 120613-1]